MNRHIHYLDTIHLSTNAAARRNVRLKDAIETRQDHEDAVIELLALWVLLGIVCTGVLLVWWW